MALFGSLRCMQSVRTRLAGPVRNIATKTATGGKPGLKPLAAAGSVLLGLTGYGVYRYNKKSISEAFSTFNLMPAVQAASFPESQPSVFSQGKNHALYLWIELEDNVNPKQIGKICSQLQKMVDQVTDPKMRDEEDEIWAGVGFGPTFLRQVLGKPKKDYTYANRRGYLGEMPSSKGDVFIHAKCNTPSKLFELAQLFVNSLPPNSVKNFEDIYSFVYQNGRDLSGFIDGTENAADEDDRQKIAVEPETGGSYVITQKWVHDMKLCATEKDKNLESWVGRSKADSTEIARKSISSHVARMTGGNGFQQKKPFEIVRQSMPFGTLSGGAGLFFIGYSASPENLNFMLDNMVGAGGDPHCDDIMRITKNIKGTYWYFPGVNELKKLA